MQVSCLQACVDVSLPYSHQLLWMCSEDGRDFPCFVFAMDELVLNAEFITAQLFIIITIIVIMYIYEL